MHELFELPQKSINIEQKERLLRRYRTNECTPLDQLEQEVKIDQNRESIGARVTAANLKEEGEIDNDEFSESEEETNP